MSTLHVPRESDQSIDARKQEMFREEPKAVAVVTSKPFAAYLRETPAKPLPPGTKMMLVGAGAVVVLLFAGTLWAGNRLRHNKPVLGPPNDVASTTQPTLPP